MEMLNESTSTVRSRLLTQRWPFISAERDTRPKSVTVVLGADTLVVTLHGALSPAEQLLARSAVGAAQVQKFHRQLFANSCEPLRQEIKRIAGVDVRDATAEVEPTSGTVVQVFTTGNMVQVFQLSQSVPTDTWSGKGNDG